MTKSQIRKYAFIKSIPIMCSYIFVSMAYGIMMEDAGFKWYYSLLVSMTVYTGAFQFVLITFLSSGASVITVALTALLMNSRQSFYSLTFLEDFKKMGKRMLYMIHTMTDETYAVNCTLELPQKEKEDAMFFGGIFQPLLLDDRCCSGRSIRAADPVGYERNRLLYDGFICNHIY